MKPLVILDKITVFLRGKFEIYAIEISQKHLDNSVCTLYNRKQLA